MISIEKPWNKRHYPLESRSYPRRKSRKRHKKRAPPHASPDASHVGLPPGTQRRPASCTHYKANPTYRTLQHEFNQYAPLGSFTRSWLNLCIRIMLWLLPVCLLVPVLLFIANKVMQFTEAVSIALSKILQALIV